MTPFLASAGLSDLPLFIRAPIYTRVCTSITKLYDDAMVELRTMRENRIDASSATDIKKNVNA